MKKSIDAMPAKTTGLRDFVSQDSFTHAPELYHFAVDQWKASKDFTLKEI